MSLKDFSECVDSYNAWANKSRIDFRSKNYCTAFNLIQDSLGNSNEELYDVFPNYDIGFTGKQMQCIVMGSIIYDNLRSLDKRISNDVVQENDSIEDMNALRAILVKRFKELSLEARIEFEKK